MKDQRIFKTEIHQINRISGNLSVSQKMNGGTVILGEKNQKIVRKVSRMLDKATAELSKVMCIVLIVIAAISSCSKPDAVQPIPIPTDYMHAEQIDHNRVAFQVDLNEPYQVHQAAGINGVVVHIAVLHSDDPCEKEVSFAFSGQRPDFYLFELAMSMDRWECDTVFIQ